MLNWVMTILSFSLLLGGSFPVRFPEPCHVVTEITVHYTDEGTVVQKRYIRQDKMNKLLNHLRNLDPYPAKDDPPEEAVQYEITLILSDGSKASYTQQGLEYLRSGDGPWQSIDPEQALRLPLILAAVPGDTDGSDAVFYN